MELLSFIGSSLWFFLPGIVGNQFPGFAVFFLQKIGKDHWNKPVSERMLGKNKTWLAYPSSVVGSTITINIQSHYSDNNFIAYSSENIYLLGFLFGVGIILGDHVKSLAKRKIMKIPPGERWWPFDQLDFLVGGLIFVCPVLGFHVLSSAIVLVPIILVLNPLVNRLGYIVGIRKVSY